MLNVFRTLTDLVTATITKAQGERKFDDAKALFDAGEFKAALPVMKEAAEMGSAHAMAHLGIIFMKGLGVQCDWKMAAKLLHMTVNLEKYQGTYFSGAIIKSNLGLITGIGGYGLRRDFKKATKYLEEAIQEGESGSSEILRMVIDRKGVFGTKETARPKIKW